MEEKSRFALLLFTTHNPEKMGAKECAQLFRETADNMDDMPTGSTAIRTMPNTLLLAGSDGRAVCVQTLAGNKAEAVRQSLKRSRKSSENVNEETQGTANATVANPDKRQRTAATADPGLEALATLNLTDLAIGAGVPPMIPNVPLDNLQEDDAPAAPLGAVVAADVTPRQSTRPKRPVQRYVPGWAGRQGGRSARKNRRDEDEEESTEEESTEEESMEEESTEEESTEEESTEGGSPPADDLGAEPAAKEKQIVRILRQPVPDDQNALDGFRVRGMTLPAGANIARQELKNMDLMGVNAVGEELFVPFSIWMATNGLSVQRRRFMTQLTNVFLDGLSELAKI